MASAIAVIGIGNPFQGDDGIGLYLLDTLKNKSIPFKIPVDFIDGGTGGMQLFHLSTQYNIILFIDAVQFEGTPGEHIFFSTKDIAFSKKIPNTLSTHSSDLYQMIKTIEDMNDNPPIMYIFGIQPKEITMKDTLSSELQSNLSILQKKLEEKIELIIQKNIINQ